MKNLFVQFSNNLINNTNSNDIANQYYKAIYTEKKEYKKPHHFFEIPLWIAEINYIIDGDLHICENLQNTIDFINNSDYTHIFFSQVDIIEQYIINIERQIKGNIITVVGRRDYSSIEQFCYKFNIKYKQGTNYQLFKGVKTIPRLQLSTGCKHKCKFCTVPNDVRTNRSNNIIQQALSFKELVFEVVYIDDKTFGQAWNYRILKQISKIIKEYNPIFKGFIVQTTASQVKKINFDGLDIFAVELGVESFNDSILKAMNKPHNEKLIIEAVGILQGLKIKIIPNLIIGLPNETKETYNKTFEFIKDINPYILNIYNLAIYTEAEISNKLRGGSNELELNTTNKANIYFYNKIYKFGINQLKKNNYEN